MAETDGPAFAPGQVWAYRTRPGEEGARVVVCRVEDDARLGGIVHIHVNGLRYKNRHAQSGFGEVIEHMPYSAESLRASVTMMDAAGTPLPDFEGGYRDWRAAFDAGRAGVWTAPLAEAVDALERAMNQ
jgi:hypothetical protein